MGSPLRGRGLFVLDRNEGFVCFPFPFGLFLHVVPALRDEVTIWVRCWLGSLVVGAAPFSPYGWASNLCLRLLFVPCPTGVFPGGPRWGRESSVVLSSLQCSSVYHVMVTCSPPTTLAPGLRLSLAPYPRSCRMGLEPLSEAPLCSLQPLATSFLVVLAEAACLRRLLDLSIVLPWLWIRLQATGAALSPCQQVFFSLEISPSG